MKSQRDRIDNSLAKTLEVRSSDVHGRGVFAKRAVRAKRLIAPYAGRVYAAEDVEAKTWDPGLTYVFSLTDGSILDGDEGGNETRFINHSCEPNCIAYQVDGDPVSVEIWSTRAIGQGEELFLDYGLDVADHDPALFSCRCAAPTCRGTMLASVCGG